MKNYFYSLFAIVILSSCGSDDDNAVAPVVVAPAPTSSLTANIDGADYTFNTVGVTQETHTVDGYTYVDLYVVATMPNDASKKIEFRVEQGEGGLGTESVYYFGYFNGDLIYDNSFPDTRSFTVSVAENTTNKLKGTFNGVLSDGDDIQISTITNGSFDISY